MTQQQKMKVVTDTPALRDLYLKELSDRQVRYGSLKGGHKIGKKRVGIQKLVLCEKAIAASIYDDNIKNIKPKTIDLFDTPELIPSNIVGILEKYEELTDGDDLSYEQVAAMQDDRMSAKPKDILLIIT